jgi:pSer/pThr/pTyr-binding forkhead associated (FHA) protein
MAPQYGAPAVNPDFLYGGAPPQYALTTGQPAHAPAPPDPYGGGPFGQPSPNAAASGRVSRAVLAGAEGVYTFPADNEVRVGRDPAQCQVVLSEPRVSSVHATGRLDASAGQFVVRDENSNNGTHVNGVRAAPGAWTPVPTGSLLRFGPAEFSVRVE